MFARGLSQVIGEAFDSNQDISRAIIEFIDDNCMENSVACRRDKAERENRVMSRFGRGQT